MTDVESVAEEASPESEDDAPAIALRGLRKDFGDVTAVDGIDLEIADGEFFSMLGPSGSGKTTVLRMIAGFEPPSEGTVLLDGGDVTRRGAVRARRQHGVPGLRALPAHVVRENVEYGLRVSGCAGPSAATRADEALATGPARAASATAGPASSPAASGSGSRWPGPW